MTYDILDLTDEMLTIHAASNLGYHTLGKYRPLYKEIWDGEGFSFAPLESLEDAYHLAHHHGMKVTQDFENSTVTILCGEQHSIDSSKHEHFAKTVCRAITSMSAQIWVSRDDNTR